MKIPSTTKGLKTKKFVDDVYQKVTRSTKAYPPLLFNAIRVRAVMAQKELLKCTTRAEVKKVLSNYEADIKILSKRASGKMGDFVDGLKDEAYGQGVEFAQESMKKRGIHFEGEEK